MQKAPGEPAFSHVTSDIILQCFCQSYLLQLCRQKHVQVLSITHCNNLRGAGGQETSEHEPYAEVRNIEANVLSSTEVTLSGSYTGASSSPAELGFYWGTSSNSLTNKLTVSSVTATGTDSGTFEAHLSDLVPGRSYVFQAFARVTGTGTYSSDEQVF